MTETTIAAISTAYGESGIGIVRLSGPDSFNIAKKVCGKDLVNRHMTLVKVKDGEQVLDEVLAVYMKAPHSYTGEDVVEFQCHGGLLATKNILSLLLKCGAVPAERGEFTKRAFLNGRMDLSQAEAVIDLIKARSSLGYDAALSQMEGSLSKSVKGIRKDLMDLLVNLTVNMDYPDEDIEQITYNNIQNSLSQIGDVLEKLRASGNEGKIVREGLSVAIVGKPNVGKSSLMNAFLHENRSIVTDVPGTTRDTVEEQATVRGITIRFIDTAGIHESTDKVEAIGIERSKYALSSADLLLVVLDGSCPLDEEDTEILNASRDIPRIIILNKMDALESREECSPRSDTLALDRAPAAVLGSDFAKARLHQEPASPTFLAGGSISLGLNESSIIQASIINGVGLEEIEDAIESFVTGGKVRKENDVLVTNVRHINLIDKALAEINQAKQMSLAGEAIDFIEVNVKAAFDYLGEIVGETASGQVIDEVFNRFCLGK